ncbi:MAG: sugar ABC transporter substrate-binding protein [Chloroflexi bacterium]|nr:sugar ABC transporter substrate-binding protein [Chloroflexota bacterium]
MKKMIFLATILALVLLPVLEMGCAPAAPATPTPTKPAVAPTVAIASPTPVPPAPVTIRWGIYEDPGRRKAAEAQVAVFKQKHPNIDVKIEAAPFAQYYDKLSAQIVAGTVYDVFMMSGANFQNIAPKGVFEELGPYLQKAGINLSDYTIEKENSEYQGKIYAVPYELDIQALYYNKDLFDKAGVKYPDDTWTWQALLEAAQKLTVDANGKHPTDPGFDAKNVAQWGFYSENLYPSYVSFIAQNGGAVLSEDRTKCTLTSPEAVEAIQFMQDLIYKYKVSPGPGQLPAGVNPFHTGKIAMRIDGSYSVNPALGITAFKWDLAPLPKGKKRAVAYWTQAIVMYNKTPNKEAAWTFINFLLSDDGQKAMGKTKMSTPSKKAIALSPDYLTGPPNNLRVFVDSYAYGRSLQFTAQWFQIMAGGTSVIAKEFDLVWLNQTTPKEACAKASEKIDKILAGQ